MGRKKGTYIRRYMLNNVVINNKTIIFFFFFFFFYIYIGKVWSVMRKVKKQWTSAASFTAAFRNQSLGFRQHYWDWQFISIYETLARNRIRSGVDRNNFHYFLDISQNYTHKVKVLIFFFFFCMFEFLHVYDSFYFSLARKQLTSAIKASAWSLRSGSFLLIAFIRPRCSF